MSTSPFQFDSGANEPLLKRHPDNPIIKPNMVPRASGILNSAVVEYGDEFRGIFRVDDLSKNMLLHTGTSKDGIQWNINPEPIEWQVNDPSLPAFKYGYDPRVVFLEGRYYITWCHDYNGYAIGLGVTDDFENFELMEIILPPWNRNAVLFPRKINGKYTMLHRPSDNGHTPFGDIFVSTSPDLIHWGRHRFVMGTRGGWQSTKIGPGPVPIETDEGWIMIYHGVINTCNGFVYSAGCAILDLDDPTKVLHRTMNNILYPPNLTNCSATSPTSSSPAPRCTTNQPTNSKSTTAPRIPTSASQPANYRN